MTGNSFTVRAHEDQAAREWFHHSSGQRVNTDVVVIQALRTQYPELDITVSPSSISFNLLAFAGAGHATATPLEDKSADPVYGTAVTWRSFVPPARRLSPFPGALVERVSFGKFLYKWKDHEFILYIADGRDGVASYPDISVHYILSRESKKVDELLKVATKWGVELHDEVWVFDQGYWQKSAELWQSVQKSEWKDVILEEKMKKAIINDVENFFDSQDTYAKLQVPWKRGIIYHGPPGNGKTISIKSMMHSLYQRGKNGDSRLKVPTLYVRTLASFAGPEYSLRMIFMKARQEAPCYLVFEDLDSIVNDQVRSYFLNEVDGLKSNDGILMVGSTNHLDQLDPGISKRPSRFDRKYLFPDPDFAQRVKYAHFWQSKLKDNDEVDFPDALCDAIAKITDKFSFAYMQEAFVASLLAIATQKDKSNLTSFSEIDYARFAGPEDPLSPSTLQNRMADLRMANDIRRLVGGGSDDLDKLILWKEMQKQVKILREEMEEKHARENTTHLQQPADMDADSGNGVSLRDRLYGVPPPELMACANPMAVGMGSMQAQPLPRVPHDEALEGRQWGRHAQAPPHVRGLEDYEGYWARQPPREEWPTYNTGLAAALQNEPPRAGLAANLEDRDFDRTVRYLRGDYLGSGGHADRFVSE